MNYSILVKSQKLADNLSKSIQVNFRQPNQISNVMNNLLFVCIFAFSIYSFPIQASRAEPQNHVKEQRLPSEGKQTKPKITSSSVLTKDILNLIARSIHIFLIPTTVSFTANMIPPDLTFVIVRLFFINKVYPAI